MVMFSTIVLRTLASIASRSDTEATPGIAFSFAYSSAARAGWIAK